MHRKILNMAEKTVKSYLMFVYGTLKRNQPNFPQLGPKHGSAVFKGYGKTAEKFPLVVASKYNIPFLLLKAGEGHNVDGELIEIDQKMLDHCDDFEGHPTYYERLETEVNLLTDENDQPLTEPRSIKCWCYFLKKYNPVLLDLTFLDSYKSTEELPYVKRYEREDESEYNVKEEVTTDVLKDDD